MSYSLKSNFILDGDKDWFLVLFENIPLKL
jgi:hypothetical protein